MRYSAVALLIMVLLSMAPAQARAVRAIQSTAPAQLNSEDATLIDETYHLLKARGDTLWPGWSKIQIPLIYITPDYEYAIGFPKAGGGFQSFSSDLMPGEKILVRKRVLDPSLAASFDVEGVDAVVIGRPDAIGRSSSEWVVTAIHEMFHVWQTSRGADQKVAALGLGSGPNASWQLNYPFPYQDPEVMRLFHLQSYLVYLAATSSDEEIMKYNAGTAVEAIDSYRSTLKRQDPTGHLYDYSKFQEWVEGIAFYTEMQMAKSAAEPTYHPSEAFSQLSSYKSYQQLWEDKLKNKIFLAKHAGRAARSRTAFYGVGMGKGFLLDRLMPDWKAHYYDANVWLDDLITAALKTPN